MSPNDTTVKTEAIIRAVDVVVCAVPTAAPLHIGAAVIREREYAVLRLHVDGGHAGTALGYTRGVPVAETLERLAPSLLGRDATRRVEIMESLRAANPFGHAALVRARSLCDIALWDVLAKAAGMPLYRLLGGARRRLPLLAVGGYFDDGEEEIRRLADAGFRHVKVHIEGVDAVADAALVARLQAAAGPDVAFAVDAHMGWRNLAEALRVCQRLDELGLSFIEDPFSPERWRLTQELQARLRTPIAAGEDALGLEALRDLVDAVTILRIDATSSGGISTVAQAIAVAASAGRGVMTHAFPDLHAQIAGGFADVDLVEMIPYESGANPVGELLARRQRVEAGEIVLDEEPGHGFPLDWEAVRRRAKSLKTFTPDQPPREDPCS